MIKRVPVISAKRLMENYNFATELLFSQAKAHYEAIERLVDEYNSIADALTEIGFMGSDVEMGEPFPHIDLGCNCTGVMNAGLIDDSWRQGRVSGGRAIESKRVPLMDERKRLGEESGWSCYYCGALGDHKRGPDGRTWHVDHSYPICRGGDNAPDNLVLACATCNLEKRSKSAAEYFRAIDRDRFKRVIEQ